MPIRIEIIDAHMLPTEVLRKTAAYLLALGGDELIARNPTPSPIVPPVAPSVAPIVPPAPTVAPEPVEEELLVTEEEFFKIPDVPIRSGVELDAKGLPWDGRIHSRTKTRVSDGTWKLMRGIDKKLVDQVESELRQVVNIPPAPTRLPFSLHEVSTTQLAKEVAQDLIEPAAIPQQELKAKMFNQVPTFHEFMMTVSGYVTAGKLTQAEIVEILKAHQIPSMPLVSTVPDLIPQLLQAIESKICGR